MPAMIQIRKFRTLGAAGSGRAPRSRALSDYLLGEIAEAAERPTVEELRARLAARTPVPSPGPALAVREDREGR